MSLANQSDSDPIINSVNQAVDALYICLEQTIDYLNNPIYLWFHRVMVAARRYDACAQGVNIRLAAMGQDALLPPLWQSLQTHLRAIAAGELSSWVTIQSQLFSIIVAIDAVNDVNCQSCIVMFHQLQTIFSSSSLQVISFTSPRVADGRATNLRYICLPEQSYRLLQNSTQKLPGILWIDVVSREEA